MFDYFNTPYKQAKEMAHQFYKDIGNVKCPYFNNEPIYFTSDGFNHLMRKGRTPRPKSVQRKRFYLLHFVKDILCRILDICVQPYRSASNQSNYS